MDQILSLCTGIGGLDLGLSDGLRAVGRSPRTVCMVEREAFSVSVLGKAIKEGWLDNAPIWCGDLRDLPTDELPAIDWITGGYPCQPFSQSGKRQGNKDPRHLWPTIFDLVRELRPSGVLFENVAGHVSLGLFDVLSDLDSVGYRTAWGVYSASSCGAPHQRERVFILGMADSDSDHEAAGGECSEDETGGRGWNGPGSSRHHCGKEHRGTARETESVAYADSERGRLRNSKRENAENAWKPSIGPWPSRPGEPSQLWESFRTTQPGLGRGTDGLPDRVDRLRALGNAVVPQQAEMAFIDLWNQLEGTQ